MSKHSYQELETRVEVLGDMVTFLMNHIPMTGFRPNGLVKADGSPDGQFLRGTAGEFYRLVKLENLETIIETPEVAAKDGENNG